MKAILFFFAVEGKWENQTSCNQKLNFSSKKALFKVNIVKLHVKAEEEFVA